MKNFIKYFLIFSLLINLSYAQENEATNDEKKEEVTPDKEEVKTEKEGVDWSSAKLYNIRLSPLGLILGSISGTADFKLKSDLSVGPSISLWSLTVGSTTISSFNFGVEAVYAMNGDIEKKGWIGTAYASYGTFSMSETYSSTDYEASVGIFSLGGLYGYQWAWGKVNVQTGAGLSFYSAAGTIDLESSGGQKRSISNPVGSGIGFGLKLTIGYRI